MPDAEFPLQLFCGHSSHYPLLRIPAVWDTLGGMFRTHKDRGRLLLAVRVHSAGWTLFLWGVLIVWACLLVLALLKPHGWRLAIGLVALVGCLSRICDYLFHPWIKFQEGGIEIPVNRDCPRVRFMRWNQIHRWSWDGDYLILTGAHSQGGAVRIPRDERLAVGEVIGTKMAVRQGMDGRTLVSDPS